MVPLQEDWVGKLWGHILGDQHHKRGGGGGQVGVERLPRHPQLLYESKLYKILQVKE